MIKGNELLFKKIDKRFEELIKFWAVNLKELPKHESPSEETLKMFNRIEDKHDKILKSIQHIEIKLVSTYSKDEIDVRFKDFRETSDLRYSPMRTAKVFDSITSSVIQWIVAGILGAIVFYTTTI